MNSKNLNLNELAYFLAYGLSVQKMRAVRGLFISDLTYADTRLSSPFETAFSAALKNELLKFEYVLKSKSESSHYIKTVCQSEDDAVKFRISILDWDQKRVVAGNYNYLSERWIKNNQVEYMPTAVLKARQLKNIVFEHAFKTGKSTGGWFKLQTVILKAKTDRAPVTNLPLTLSRTDKAIFKSASTDEQGVVNFNLKSESEAQTILASVDLPKFLELPADHYFITTLTAPEYNFYLDRSIVKVYLSSDEKNLNDPLAVNFLEPQIKPNLKR